MKSSDKKRLSRFEADLLRMKKTNKAVFRELERIGRKRRLKQFIKRVFRKK